PWTGPTVGRVEASIRTGDAFPLDDHAYAVFAPARPLSVLVVGPQSYFVAQALAALPGVTVKEQAAPAPGPVAGASSTTPADVVVYVGVDPPALENGSFILFGAVPPNLPLRVRGVLSVPPVTGWSRADSLLGSVSLSGITVGKALDLEPGAGFSVLAASGTSPLLLSWDHAGVKALVAAFDPAASDFPLRPGFPVLLANVLSWFHPEWLQVQADQLQAGDPRAIPTEGAAAVTVVKPDGQRETLPADGPSVRMLDTDETGFYHVEAAGKASDFAANLASDTESDTTPRFAAPSAAVEGGAAPASLPAPAWRAFAAAALALLLLELLAWRLRQRGGSEPLGSARTRTFFALRAAAVVCLALCLAGLAVARFSDRLSVVFVLDQSRSVSAADRQKALALVEDIRGRLARGDTSSLVRFGASAETETLEPGLPVAQEGVDVDTSATDVGAGIQDALAQAGRGGSTRIVLLTDGNENRGDADSAAEAARSMGARIFPVALGGTPSGTEVAVDDVRAPSRVRQDEAHEVTVMVRSRTPVTARITLLRDTVPMAARVQSLSPGENAVQFTGSFPDRGLHAWDALVEAPGDQVAQNNHDRRLVEVSGAPQVLYVSRGKGSPSLLAALAAQGISVVSRPPSALPGTLAGYLPYDALIMDNVPGYGISTEKMETIAQYVRDAGGGLLMAGGGSSFGAGGYYKTPIERVLPVDMDAKSQVQVPGLSLVILVDKSGSMGATVPTGESKLDVVKSAALAAIESLNPFDRAGVIAFDADWQWAVPLTSAGDVQKITDGLATLEAGGGTVMYPALEEADRALAQSTSP
ncbi:MAG TPA: VWA domain-containing protein, partial [bacterium]|nr:VWA domain-containing protein [bacterium]